MFCSNLLFIEFKINDYKNVNYQRAKTKLVCNKLYYKKHVIEIYQQFVEVYFISLSKQTCTNT